MGPPELPGGNLPTIDAILEALNRASMGPPELPGGNRQGQERQGQVRRASMGPPELPGGNGRGKMEKAIEEVGLQWGRRNYPAETV